MDGLNDVNRGPMTLLSFNRREDLEAYNVGADKDIGGSTTAALDFVPDDVNDGGDIIYGAHICEPKRCAKECGAVS